MLLPIVLLLASAGSMPQTANATAAAPHQFSTTNQDQMAPDGFVLRRRSPDVFDKGMIIPQPTHKAGCLSITAYVFSDGENPQLQYVTHCPNLDVPYLNKRAQGKGMRNDQQPTIKRTN